MNRTSGDAEALHPEPRAHGRAFGPSPISRGVMDQKTQHMGVLGLTGHRPIAPHRAMSGRTDRVNARELSDRVETIIFEGTSAKGWLEELVRRSATALKSARANKYYAENYGEEMKELEEAHASLEQAANALDALERAERRRQDAAA